MGTLDLRSGKTEWPGKKIHVNSPRVPVKRVYTEPRITSPLIIIIRVCVPLQRRAAGRRASGIISPRACISTARKSPARLLFIVHVYGTFVPLVGAAIHSRKLIKRARR